MSRSKKKGEASTFDSPSRPSHKYHITQLWESLTKRRRNCPSASGTRCSESTRKQAVQVGTFACNSGLRINRRNEAGNWRPRSFASSTSTENGERPDNYPLRGECDFDMANERARVRFAVRPNACFPGRLERRFAGASVSQWLEHCPQSQLRRTAVLPIEAARLTNVGCGWGGAPLSSGVSMDDVQRRWEGTAWGSRAKAALAHWQLSLFGHSKFRSKSVRSRLVKFGRKHSMKRPPLQK